MGINSRRSSMANFSFLGRYLASGLKTNNFPIIARQHAKLSLAAYHRAPIGTPNTRVPVARDTKLHIQSRPATEASTNIASENQAGSSLNHSTCPPLTAADTRTPESSFVEAEESDMARRITPFEDYSYYYDNSEIGKPAYPRYGK